jgi:hypothetical protein
MMKHRLLFLLPAIGALLIVSAAPQSPFACNRAALSAAARKRHFDELGPRLHTMTKRVRELPGGFEFEFPADTATVQLLSEWAAGETLCCPFFDIDLHFEHEGGGLWLRLSGREGVKQFIRSDLAPWFPPSPRRP